MLVQRKLKKLGLSVKSRPNEIGYELRCVRPIAYDLSYASILGMGVMKLYQEGATGCMVTQTPEGDVMPLYLKDVEDENGKVKPRLVNMDSAKNKLVFENSLNYITKNDYKAAKKYLAETGGI